MFMVLKSKVRRIDCSKVDRWQLVHAGSHGYQPFRVVDMRVVQHEWCSLAEIWREEEMRREQEMRREHTVR